MQRSSQTSLDITASDMSHATSEASDSIIYSQASSGTLRHLVLRHPQASSPNLIQLRVQAAPDPFSIPQPQTLFSESHICQRKA